MVLDILILLDSWLDGDFYLCGFAVDFANGESRKSASGCSFDCE
jgi:hypothetical protein